MCLSQVCAKLAQKFWSLLNQPASHGPFRPKLWTSLATVFVDIFWKEKNWVGFRPFPMTHWKEFLISWKKRRFEIFWSSWKSTLTLSTPYLKSLTWKLGFKSWPGRTLKICNFEVLEVTICTLHSWKPLIFFLFLQDQWEKQMLWTIKVHFVKFCLSKRGQR